MLIAAAVTAALYLPAGAFAATSPDDLAQIREQLRGLVQRVDKLEQENAGLKTENEQLRSEGDYLKAEAKGLRKDTASLQADTAKVKGTDWASRIAIKGDLRYRHEQISDPTRRTAPGFDEDQTRQRIRARLGFDAKVTDNIVVGLQVATGGDDPRSSNQTLGGASSRKSIGLDLAYFDWKFADWGDLIGGKMKYPFVRPGQSLFYDGDINPEGLAVMFNRGLFFGSAYGFWIDERNNVAPASPTAATSCIAASGRCSKDVFVLGGQFGARVPVGASTLVAAIGYSDLQNGQGQRPFYNNNPNGNSVTAGGNVGGLQYDFNVIEGLVEYNAQLGTLPLQVWGNYAQNLDPDDMNTAWSAGVLFGKASNARTWEAGFAYEVLEKNALFGQFVDSDFNDGVTDGQGWLLRAGYAPLKNWSLNATYFINERNRDVANALFGTKTDYDRLQVDFNVKF